MMSRLIGLLLVVLSTIVRGRLNTVTILSPNIETLPLVLSSGDVRQFISNALGLEPSPKFELAPNNLKDALRRPQIIVVGVLNEFSSGVKGMHTAELNTNCENLDCLVDELLPQSPNVQFIQLTKSLMNFTVADSSTISALIQAGTTSLLSTALPTTGQAAKCSALALDELTFLQHTKDSIGDIKEGPMILLLTPIKGLTCFQSLTTEDTENISLWTRSVSKAVNIATEDILNVLSVKYRMVAAIATFESKVPGELGFDSTCDVLECSLLMDGRRLQEVISKAQSTVSESKAQRRQIVIWISVLLVFIVLFVLYSMLNMQTTKDPLLYTKLAATR